MFGMVLNHYLQKMKDVYKLFLYASRRMQVHNVLVFSAVGHGDMSCYTTYDILY